jgi:hypothetical protein
MKKNSLIFLFAAMSIVAQSQTELLNGAFEDTLIRNIGGETDTLAHDWSTSPFGTGITTDAAEGEFAAYVWNWYFYGEGYLINGANSDPWHGGTPINFRPSSLSGYSKYIIGSVISENDSAYINVTLTKFNVETHSRDTIGKGSMRFGASNEYLLFNIGIDYASAEQPDTVEVRVGSSIGGFCGDNSGGNCLYFYVDNLQLNEGTTGMSENVVFNQNIAYPNPAQGVITINQPIAQSQLLQLFSSEGKLVAQRMLLPEKVQSVDVADLPAGLYFIRLQTDNSVQKIQLN